MSVSIYRDENRMAQPSQTPDNLLLAALPDEERNRLNPFLKRVELSVGDEVTIPERRSRIFIFRLTL